MTVLASSPFCIVSACLCGIPCRYDGRSHANKSLTELYKKGLVLPICPEEAGGLSVPRPPCELKNGRAVTSDGTDVTDAILTGATKALRLALKNEVRLAILKDKSPSCGSTAIYDGTFTGNLISGRGITGSLLAEHGIHVVNERLYNKVINAGADVGIDFFELFS